MESETSMTLFFLLTAGFIDGNALEKRPVGGAE